MSDFDDLFTTEPTSPAGVPNERGGAATDPSDEPVAGDDAHPPTRWDRRMLAALGAAIVILVIAAAVVVHRNQQRTPAAGPHTISAADTASQTTTTPTSSTTSTTVRAATPVWPLIAQGRPTTLGPEPTPPAQVGGARPGVYVWTDYHGWHIWIVNGGGISGLHGAVVSDALIERATPAGRDQTTVHTTNNVIQFTLPAQVPVAGIDFNPGFYSKVLRFKLDGPNGPYAVNEVMTGGFSVPASNLPLIIEKARL